MKTALTAAFASLVLLSCWVSSANGTVITDPNPLRPNFTTIDFEGFSNGQSFSNPLLIEDVSFTSGTGALSILDIAASGWPANGTEVASKTLFPGGEPDSAISITFAAPVSEFLLGWEIPTFPETYCKPMTPPEISWSKARSR